MRKKVGDILAGDFCNDKYIFSCKYQDGICTLYPDEERIHLEEVPRRKLFDREKVCIDKTVKTKSCRKKTGWDEYYRIEVEK